MEEKYYDINRDGYSVHCKLYGSGQKHYGRLIVYGHGFGGHKDNRAGFHYAERIIGKYKDIALLCFDWPCHGQDARKKLSLRECETYLRLVLEDCKERFTPKDIYGFANSYGGFLYLDYLHKFGNPFRKVFLKSPAIPMLNSLKNNILDEASLKKLHQGKVVEAGFDRKVKIDNSFLEELREADITKLDFTPFLDDIMIIHGDKDELIPFETVKEFAEGNFLYFKPIEGADHRYQNPHCFDLSYKEMVEFFGLGKE